MDLLEDDDSFSGQVSEPRELDWGGTFLPEGNQTWSPVWELSHHYSLIRWGARYLQPIHTKTQTTDLGFDQTISRGPSQPQQFCDSLILYRYVQENCKF